MEALFLGVGVRREFHRKTCASFPRFVRPCQAAKKAGRDAGSKKNLKIFLRPLTEVQPWKIVVKNGEKW
jgi:hypothetical protein